MAGLNNIRTGRLASRRLLAPRLLARQLLAPRMLLVMVVFYLAASLTDLWGYLPPVVQATVYILLFIAIIISLLRTMAGKNIRPAPAGFKALSLSAILLAVAAIRAGPDSQRLLEIALKPRAIFSYPVPEIIMTVTPPSYSGRKKFTENLSVGDEKSSNLTPIVQGSNITVRVINTAYAPTLVTGSRRVRFLADKTGGFSAHFTLTNETGWQVRAGSRRLGQWPIFLLKDEPPVIHRAIFHPIKTAMGLFRLSLDLSDDFGVKNVVVGIISHNKNGNILRDRTNLDISGLKQFSGEVYGNFSASDFAGRTVDLAVEVTDQAGQKSKKIISAITLPGRNFSNAVARQLIKIRREILSQPGIRKKLARQLMALGLAPDNGQPDIYYLALRTAYWRLINPENDGDINSARNILWQLADGLEDGGRSRFTSDILALLTTLKMDIYRKQPVTMIRAQLGKIDKKLILFQQMQNTSPPYRYQTEKYDVAALRRIYDKILADSYYKKTSQAINLISYLEQGFIYDDPLILSGQGYAYFRMAHHARKTVNILEEAQKQVMNFVLKKTVHLGLTQTKTTDSLNMPRKKDIRTWINIQQKLGKKMNDLGRTLQKSGIDAARFTVPAGDLAREVIHSMEDGNMSAAVGYQSQIMTILQSLGNMLDQKMHHRPKDL